MTPSLQPVQPGEQTVLAAYLAPLLLMTVALFFTALTGISTILQGKIRLLFSYWQCFPCLMMLFSACLLPRKTAICANAAQKTLLASIALLALSPFPTWAVRSSENTYFHLCSIACLAVIFWLQLEICQLLRILAEHGKIPLLAVSARKTQFLLLCFEIVPVCAVYGSGILGLFTGTSRSFQDVLRIWNYGQISLMLRIFLYWSLLQFFFLCLSATWMAAAQLKKILAETAS